MTNGADNLPERVQAIEEKLDALASSVDGRFDQVHSAMVEQRAYTEFAYEKLDSKIDAGFRKMDAGFREMDARFAKVDGRFDRLERKIDQIIDLQIPKRPRDGSNEA